jgi:hypothetical protein
LDVNPTNVIKAIHSVSEDGNCGFRAVSFDVYKTQDNWIQVKEDMLATYMHEENYNTLYKTVGDSSTIDFEHQAIIARLSSRISPCNINRSLWFTNFTSPQIIADTYHRPVIVYTYSEFTLNKIFTTLNFNSTKTLQKLKHYVIQLSTTLLSAME